MVMTKGTSSPIPRKLRRTYSSSNQSNEKLLVPVPVANTNTDTTAMKNNAVFPNNRKRSSNFSLKSVVAIAKTTSESQRREQEKRDKEERQFIELGAELVEQRQQQQHHQHQQQHQHHQQHQQHQHHHQQQQHHQHHHQHQHQHQHGKQQQSSQNNSNVRHHRRNNSDSNIGDCHHHHHHRHNNKRKGELRRTTSSNDMIRRVSDGSTHDTSHHFRSSSSSFTNTITNNNNFDAVVYVSNIAPDAIGEDLLGFLKKMMSVVYRTEYRESVRVINFCYRRQEGSLKNEAFVEFLQPRDAMNAVFMKNRNLRGQDITIEHCSSRGSDDIIPPWGLNKNDCVAQAAADDGDGDDVDKNNNENEEEIDGGDGGDDVGKESHKGNHRRPIINGNRKGKDDGNYDAVVYVGNIESNETGEEFLNFLKKIMASEYSYGLPNVITFDYRQSIYNAGGCNCNEAFVEFSTPAEADRAFRLNKCRVFHGRMITIEKCSLGRGSENIIIPPWALSNNGSKNIVDDVHSTSEIENMDVDIGKYDQETHADDSRRPLKKRKKLASSFNKHDVISDAAVVLNGVTDVADNSLSPLPPRKKNSTDKAINNEDGASATAMTIPMAEATDDDKNMNHVVSRDGLGNTTGDDTGDNDERNHKNRAMQDDNTTNSTSEIGNQNWSNNDTNDGEEEDRNQLSASTQTLLQHHIDDGQTIECTVPSPDVALSTILCEQLHNGGTALTMTIADNGNGNGNNNMSVNTASSNNDHIPEDSVGATPRRVDGNDDVNKCGRKSNGNFTNTEVLKAPHVAVASRCRDDCDRSNHINKNTAGEGEDEKNDVVADEEENRASFRNLKIQYDLLLRGQKAIVLSSKALLEKEQKKKERLQSKYDAAVAETMKLKNYFENAAEAIEARLRDMESIFERQNNRLKNQLKTINSKCDSAEKETSHWKRSCNASLAENDDKSKKIEESKRAFGDLQNAYDVAMKENIESNKGVREMYDSVVTEKKEVAECLNQERSKNESLLKRVKQMQEKAEKTIATHHQLKAKSESQNNTNSQVEKQLKDLRRKHASIVLEHSRSAIQHDDLRSKYNSVFSKLAEKTKALEVYTTTYVESLHAENDTFVAERSQLTSKLTLKTRELDAERDAGNRLKDEKESREIELEGLMNDNHVYAKRVEESSIKLEKLTEEVKAREAIHKNCREETIRKHAKELNEARATAAAAVVATPNDNGTIIELKKELKSKQDDFNDIAKAMGSQVMISREQREEIRELKERLRERAGGQDLPLKIED